MRFTKTIASASVAAVLGLGGISVAGAASTSSSTPASSSTTPTAAAPAQPAAKTPEAKKAARALRRRHVVRRGVVTAAKTIGIKPVDLAKELRSGKTIAEVATAHGVQPQAVIDALKTAATAKIEKAKAANKITADRATKLEARLDKIVPKFVDDWHLKAKSK
jgi:hypothetical protein